MKNTRTNLLKWCSFLSIIVLFAVIGFSIVNIQYHEAEAVLNGKKFVSAKDGIIYKKEQILSKFKEMCIDIFWKQIIDKNALVHTNAMSVVHKVKKL